MRVSPKIKALAEITKRLKHVAFVANIFGVYYINGLRRTNSFKPKSADYFLTILSIFCYVLLYVYSIFTNLTKTHYIILLYVTYATFNNIMIVVTMFYNQKKICTLMKKMAEITAYSEKIDVTYNFNKSFCSTKNMFCFVIKGMTASLFMCLGYISFSCKLLMVLAYLNNASIQLNFASFFNFSAHFFKQSKKATVAYLNKSKYISSIIVKKKLVRLSRLHLKICNLANATHKTFYLPLLVGLATKCINLFSSPVLVYFTFMNILTDGFNVEDFTILAVSLMIFVCAAVASFHLADSYAYMAFKANTFAMSMVNVQGLTCNRDLDDYIQHCSLQFLHQKLNFLVGKISPINRQLVYSGLGSIISVF